MPTAFLSHSSKDKKEYLDYVASKLKKNFRVYDQDTFGIGLRTIDEIFSGLAATDLFVLFISNTSLDSEWVKKEIFEAERLFRTGNIRRIFPIVIDPEVSYKDPRIPEWLRKEYNLRPISRPSVGTRLIEQRLRELSWQTHPKLLERKRIFVGRHEQIAQIEERFNDYDKPTPTCVIASGIPSIGRRSLLSHAIKKATAVPSESYIPPTIVLTAQDSIEDLVVKIYDLGSSETTNINATLQDTLERKIELAVKLCSELAAQDEFLLIEDNGCIVSHERRIADWFKEIILKLTPENRLQLAVASRFRPDFSDLRSNQILHIATPELTPKDRIGLLKRYSELEGVQLTPNDYDYFKDTLSGYPEQVQYLLSLITSEGIDYAKKNTNLLVEFNRNKAETLVQTTVKSDDELEILMLLSQFEFISYTLLEKFIDINSIEESLNRFIGAALCERIGSSKEYIRLNDTIRDYLLRQRLGLPEKYQSALTAHAREFVKSYSAEEVDASDYLYSLQKLLTSGDSVPPTLLIPSHFLKAMKELYDRYRKHDDVIRLADQVLNSNQSLEKNIEREIRHFLCLSLARQKSKRFTSEVRFIDGPEHNFLFGFYYRITGRVSDAIERQKQAIEHTKTASRASRELVQLYVSIEDYESAIKLAKKNHESNPSNPFHAEAYFKCLINLSDWKKSEPSIASVLRSMQEAKSLKAREMYLNCQAQYEAYCLKNPALALKTVETAVDEFPESPYPLFTKIGILFRQRDIGAIKEQLTSMGTLLKKKEQFSDALDKMNAQLIALEGDMDGALRIVSEKLGHLPESAITVLRRRLENAHGLTLLQDPDQSGTD